MQLHTVLKGSSSLVLGEEEAWNFETICITLKFNKTDHLKVDLNLLLWQ
jgi:hypothetical protein